MTAANNERHQCLFVLLGYGQRRRGARNGLIFYGIYGRFSLPFATDDVREDADAAHAGSVVGGAAGTCNGVFSLDWNAYRLANPYAIGSRSTSARLDCCRPGSAITPAPAARTCRVR